MNFLGSILIQLRNGIDCVTIVSSALFNFRLLSWLTSSSIFWSVVGMGSIWVPFYIPSLTGLRSCLSLLRLSLFLYCYSSCISWTFRAFFSGSVFIRSILSAAVILNSMASFSLLNTRVLGLSATAPVYFIAYLWYLIGSLCINHCLFSRSERFPAATAFVE